MVSNAIQVGKASSITAKTRDRGDSKHHHLFPQRARKMFEFLL